MYTQVFFYFSSTHFIFSSAPSLCTTHCCSKSVSSVYILGRGDLSCTLQQVCCNLGPALLLSFFKKKHISLPNLFKLTSLHRETSTWALLRLSQPKPELTWFSASSAEEQETMANDLLRSLPNNLSTSLWKILKQETPIQA